MLSIVLAGTMRIRMRLPRLWWDTLSELESPFPGIRADMPIRWPKKRMAPAACEPTRFFLLGACLFGGDDCQPARLGFILRTV